LRRRNARLPRTPRGVHPRVPPRRHPANASNAVSGNGSSSATASRRASARSRLVGVHALRRCVSTRSHERRGTGVGLPRPRGSHLPAGGVGASAGDPQAGLAETSEAAPMRVGNLFRFLIGSRQAILELAADPRSLGVGLLLVISAALAREYDGSDLLL